VVTGGTRGLGKAIGMEFARVGAAVFLTHRWSSVDEQDLVGEFSAAKVGEPTIIECDVSDREATRELMQTILARVGGFDVLVSSVSFAKVVHDLQDFSYKALELSLAYSAWPIVDYLQAAKEVIGQYPRYVIGVSSDGADTCSEGYDLVGISKSVLETLCRYLAYRLKPQGVRVNAIRPWYVDTASFRATFGEEIRDALKKKANGIFLDPQSVGHVCVALCSGYMDAVTGQVIAINEGWSNISPIAFLTGQGLPGAFPEKVSDDL
jgi:NAD(P)-dependent dehydrogenase (short-subunit alcohol dehydrogenase family)